MPEFRNPFNIDADSFSVLARFRERIAAAGYTKQGLLDLLSRYIDTDRRLDLDAIRLVAAGGLPQHLLCRIFMTGQEVDQASLEKVIGTELVRDVTRIGLFARAGGSLRSAGQLTPIEDKLVLSDFGPEVTGSPYPPDFVLGVGTASLNLAGLTVRRHADNALDMGAGGGIQALIAARHCGKIVCTDVNARALGFAAFNFALNGVENAELREGSLYSPVEGETFDLIVSNPPFVISPEDGKCFRSEATLKGDAVSRAVVEGAGSRLNQGGFAAVLLNWGHDNDLDWHAKPLQWVADSGCGRWLMCFDTEEPSVYARRWLRDGNRFIAGGEFAAQMQRWLAYYSELGFNRVSTGVMVMHKPGAGATWARYERISRNVLGQGECGVQIGRICMSESALANAKCDDAILDMKLRLSGDHKLVHVMHVKEGRWSLSSSTLINSTGFDMAGNMDIASMALLERCDGKVTLRAALALAASAIGEDPAALGHAVAAAAKNLMRKGHLEVC